LAKKIAKWERLSSEASKREHELNEFLTPHRTLPLGIKPTLNQHYCETFNVVDRFNRLTSSIAFATRITNEKFRIFIGLIETTIVQVLALTQDWKTGTSVAAEQPRMDLFFIWGPPSE
jgi:hypothetical protein